jgi:uncharacterized membrane protein YebE (DUF533 family)
MFNVEKLLGQMLSGGMGGSRKRSRSGAFGIPGVSKAQLGVGAIGLAIAAWEHFKSSPGATPAASGPAPPMAPPPPPLRSMPPASAPPPMVATTAALPAAVDAGDQARVADAAHLIRSMIAAANADAVIDAEERAGILERALEAGLDAATQQFLMGELRAPASLEQIAAATRPELRLETYAAALIAINIDNDAERVYIERLAAALNLSAEDQRQVRQQLGMP